MASEAKVDQEEAALVTRIPRPVEGGIEYLESLGRFVDDLMGDSRRRKRAQAELEPLLLREDEMPEDPPPSEPPPPVTGVSDSESRGRRLEAGR